MGLFAPAAVRVEDYEAVKRWPGVKEALRRRPEIDMVITSLASAEDPDGDLHRFHTVVKGNAGRGKRVGDVQYRSYDARGPLHPKRGMRAVTLFEVEDLADLAKQRDKAVLVVAGPCGVCGRLRTDALRPLLENPRLEVWTQIVLDLDTAEEIRG